MLNTILPNWYIGYVSKWIKILHLNISNRFELRTLIATYRKQFMTICSHLNQLFTKLTYLEESLTVLAKSVEKSNYNVRVLHSSLTVILPFFWAFTSVVNKCNFSKYLMCAQNSY